MRSRVYSDGQIVEQGYYILIKEEIRLLKKEGKMIDPGKVSYFDLKNIISIAKKMTKGYNRIDIQFREAILEYFEE